MCDKISTTYDGDVRFTRGVFGCYFNEKISYALMECCIIYIFTFQNLKYFKYFAFVKLKLPSVGFFFFFFFFLLAKFMKPFTLSAFECSDVQNYFSLYRLTVGF